MHLYANGYNMEEKDLFLFMVSLIPDLEMSDYQFSKYDCYSRMYKMDIELKCRRSHYDDLMIEKIKYDALMKRAKKFGTRPVYVNSTPKGIWAFYLDECFIDWWSKDLPKTTDFDINDKVHKIVGYLSIHKGRQLQ